MNTPQNITFWRKLLLEGLTTLPVDAGCGNQMSLYIPHPATLQLTS